MATAPIRLYRGVFCWGCICWVVLPFCLCVQQAGLLNTDGERRGHYSTVEITGSEFGTGKRYNVPCVLNTFKSPLQCWTKTKKRATAEAHRCQSRASNYVMVLCQRGTTKLFKVIMCQTFHPVTLNVVMNDQCCGGLHFRRFRACVWFYVDKKINCDCCDKYKITHWISLCLIIYKL